MTKPDMFHSIHEGVKRESVALNIEISKNLAFPVLAH